MDDSVFGRFVRDQHLTTFKALSELDVVNLGMQISELTGEVNRITTDLTQIKNEVDQVAILVNSLNAKVNSLENQVITNTENISEFNQQIAILVDQVNLLELSVTSSLEAMSVRLDSLTSSVSNLSNSVNTLTSKVTTLEVSVSTLTTKMTTVEGSLFFLTDRVTALEARPYPIPLIPCQFDYGLLMCAEVRHVNEGFGFTNFRTGKYLEWGKIYTAQTYRYLENDYFNWGDATVTFMRPHVGGNEDGIWAIQPVAQNKRYVTSGVTLILRMVRGGITSIYRLQIVGVGSPFNPN